jgi:hypothetical protein
MEEKHEMPGKDIKGIRSELSWPKKRMLMQKTKIKLGELTFFPGSTDSLANAWPASFSERFPAAASDQKATLGR